MKTIPYRRNYFFYPIVFGAWTALILVLHGGYQYHGTPFMSAGFEKAGGGIQGLTLLPSSIAALRNNYTEERNPLEKAHILQNIGCAYFDLYRATGDRPLLDSALIFMHQSTVGIPPNARFFYNLGRIFTEASDHAHALEYYNLTLRYDSTHILALSNAGTCSYFAFGKRKESAKYFRRALAIDSLLPICNLILGFIAMDGKDSIGAIRNFESELRADSLAFMKSKYPLQQSNIRFAASGAHRNLLTLYSTRVPDRPKAEYHLREYLALESAPEKREAAEKEMKKFWAGRR